ncbi:helix-turn-helix domain-containing protein [Caulobacter sp. RL271]|uniref:Helix-turn-helix domain-containing protein n=1 Tax=Caulobacter segnis TaxID=88688 RepID=A0ABY4ZV02_9CAUL|nr:helix-turn-helix domain-containing protein [Caulobacter segnis]USQ96528.1 helix-turn-helix domain-containing protein [Caulobacter segnis]
MDTFKTESLPVYLSTVEAAQLLRLSPRTLEKHRLYGTGPSFRKIGGRVIYAAADLVAWAETGAKTSTSDPRCGPRPARRQSLPLQ